MSLHRDTWQQHGGMYRPILNFRSPWIPSPPSILFPSEGSPQYVTSEKLDDSGIERRRSRCGFWRFVKDLLLGTPGGVEYKSSLLDAVLPPPRILLSEWKAWGYYSRPRVNGVEVRNSSPGPISPAGINPHEVFARLRSPGGTGHPELWIPGLEHPSIPPRPGRWSDPRPGEPLPFPWECQLNPFLEHKLFGVSALYWDLGQPHGGILYGEAEATIPLSPADKAQPATWPFLTHMYINAVADDTAPHFPWPFMVFNPRGIKCEDVFEAIFENFQQHVSQHEHDSWSALRQRQSGRAYHIRLASEDREGDGLRRIDYLGHRVMFRGLEPNPNRDGSGWVMFIGPP